MYYYLLYLGIARKEFSENDLELLLHQSRSRNENLNISGKLIHCEGTFIQLLEGSETAVEDVYNSIKKDDRLIATKLIATGKIKERYFKEWSMAYKEVSLEEINEIENCTHPNVGEYIKKASSVKLLRLLAKA